MSGTRLSKWNGAIASAERRRPDTQRTINVSPADNDAIHPGVPLGSGCVTTNITNPDVYRVLSITGSQGGMSGNVFIIGTDWAGNAICDRMALSGTTTVSGVKPFKTVTKICVPAGTGDVLVGTTNKLGLYHPVSATSDVLQQGRKATAANAYTLEAVGTVDATYATVLISSITNGDSFEWNYLATK